MPRPNACGTNKHGACVRAVKGVLQFFLPGVAGHKVPFVEAWGEVGLRFQTTGPGFYLGLIGTVVVEKDIVVLPLSRHGRLLLRNEAFSCGKSYGSPYCPCVFYNS